MSYTEEEKQESLKQWQSMLETLRAWEKANPEKAAALPWAEARRKWEEEVGVVEFDERMLTPLTYVNNRKTGLRQALHELFYQRQVMPDGRSRLSERRVRMYPLIKKSDLARKKRAWAKKKAEKDRLKELEKNQPQ